MIVVRAPLRISFVGGGTDLPDFYRKSPGKVISTTIDKYVYVVINRTPLIPKASARYAISETVDKADNLQHTRIRAALLDLGIERGIEIASFASLPSKTGLGSSSSFSVALMKGLYAYVDKKIDNLETAKQACRLEIELLKEPIGKQDQYAASIGGFNIFKFNPDESVEMFPILLDYKKKIALQNHLLIFFTGITRSASSVLKEQKANIGKKIGTLKQMAESVDEFAVRLLDSDFKGLGKMLYEGWLKKKSLANKVSNNILDDFYNAGMDAGAWGGKILGAGGGGCIMFLATPQKHTGIRKAIARIVKKNGLEDSQELPVVFVQSGAEILFKADYH